MTAILTQLKIRPGKAKRTIAFLKKLNRRQKEMQIVLKESGIALDCSFISGNTLYIFKKLKTLKQLKHKIKYSELPIYNEIREWADECLSSRKDIKSIATFEKSTK
ncbi:MAG: hypothetical protein COV45_00060 [Deltaproteobacteria bacterium CG11_big_fil_rev_8_21_14_0_20_47_16]|nr:MAG: hypothetical protein COV45_00060 [Deltaproteobacteria bacterium CG11_big_fil_rev_8_21_14_0_20_47_16]